MLRFIFVSLILGTVAGFAAPDAEMHQKIISLISQMTLEEKVAMCRGNTNFTNPGVPRLGIPTLHLCGW